MDDLVDVPIGEEMRRFHFFLLPLASNVDAQQLVVLLENLPESGVVQILIVLEEDQREIKFGEGELELLDLPVRQGSLLQRLV